MKMRFEIEFENPERFIMSYIKDDIVMKYISYVIIDGVKYDKPIDSCKIVQSFYYFMSKNRKKVTEILMNDGCHIFLKEGKLHSYDTYCYNNSKFKQKFYAKNGRILDHQEVIFFERELKLKRIKEKI